MADDSADTGDIGSDALSSGMDGVRTRTRDLTAGSNAFARAITNAFAQGAAGAKSFGRCRRRQTWSTRGQGEETSAASISKGPIALCSKIDNSYNLYHT